MRAIAGCTPFISFVPITVDDFKRQPVDGSTVRRWLDALGEDVADILSFQYVQKEDVRQETARIMQRIRGAWERLASPPLMVILERVAREEKGSIGIQLEDCARKLRLIHDERDRREGKLMFDEEREGPAQARVTAGAAEKGEE